MPAKNGDPAPQRRARGARADGKTPSLKSGPMLPPFDERELAEALAGEHYSTIVAGGLPPARVPTSGRSANTGRVESSERLSARTSRPRARRPIAAHEPPAGAEREMSRRFLEHALCDALVLAERILAQRPEHVLAALVRSSCREQLGAPSTPSP